MDLYNSESATILFLQVLAKAKDENTIKAIYQEDLSPLLETEYEKTAPYILCRLLLTQLAELIKKSYPIKDINKFAENIMQVMLFVDIKEGIRVPRTTYTLLRLIEVFNYFYEYGDYVFHTDITRAIDAALVSSGKERILFASILGRPH